MIFLSASIPDCERDPKYYDTADIISIRDAVRALATLIIPNSTLVWGGHPAITPLIRNVMTLMNSRTQDHIILYQSEFFADRYPMDNEFFKQVVFTKKNDNLELSLEEMRMRMISENQFKACVLIGGMEGVEIEYEMFIRYHPNARVFPIASTGAAAKTIYNRTKNDDSRLLKDYAYLSLFRSLFQNLLELD
jgi:hypothetical protein